MARTANASDYEIVEAYLHHVKKTGKEPSNYYLRKETGASYGLIDNVLERYKRHDSLEAFIASENDKAEVLKQWLLELITPVAEDIIQKTDEDIQKHQQALDGRFKEKQKEIRSLQDKLSSSRAEIDELKLQLLETYKAHEKTQEKLETTLDTLQEKSIAIAEMRVELNKTNEMIEQKSSALENSNRNFDHAMKESARQRKSLEAQLDKLSSENAAALQAANTQISVARENSREAEDQAALFGHQLDKLQSEHQALLTRNENMAREIHRLTEQLLDAQSKLKVSYIQLEERQKSAQSQVEQLHLAQDERNQYYTALQKAQSANIHLERTNAQLEYTNQQLQHQNEQLKSMPGHEPNG